MLEPSSPLFEAARNMRLEELIRGERTRLDLSLRSSQIPSGTAAVRAGRGRTVCGLSAVFPGLRLYTRPRRFFLPSPRLRKFARIHSMKIHPRGAPSTRLFPPAVRSTSCNYRFVRRWIDVIRRLTEFAKASASTGLGARKDFCWENLCDAIKELGRGFRRF